MGSISRNDPCPCGSGLKYKKCCIDTVLSFPSKNKSDEFQMGAAGILEKVKEDFSNREFESIEEVNRELSTYYNDYNNRPIDTFLGLSPTQMAVVLNTSFTLGNIVFEVEDVVKEEIIQIPLMKQVLHFLNKLKEAVELKATQKGNLPKAFVIELYEEFFKDDKYARKPCREDDLPQATRLKHLLEMAGLMKKRNNKFSLTKKATIIIEKSKIKDLFELIFTVFANKWNWGFFDGYPEMYMIQRSVAFNFLIIHNKCKDWTLDDVLGKAYLEAFPEIVREIPPISYSTPEQRAINCFNVRFLSRFCVPMGILEVKHKRVKKEKYFETVEYYKTTEFFNKNFKFLI
jgi:hypothetical protein